VATTVPKSPAQHIEALESALEQLRQAANEAHRELRGSARVDAAQVLDQAADIADTIESLAWTTGVKQL
jgi:cell division septum initiation protein DivIVA